MPQDSSAFTSLRKGIAMSNVAQALRVSGVPKPNNVSGAIQYNISKPAGFSRGGGSTANITLNIANGNSSGGLNFPSVTRIVVNVINASITPYAFSFSTTQNVYATSMVSNEFADSIVTSSGGGFYLSTGPSFTPLSTSFTVTLTFPTPITFGAVGLST
jgi:hypothetical protein